MQVQKVERFPGQNNITCVAVTSKPFDEKGNNEDNTYAKFSPMGQLTLSIANPTLIGKIEPGQKFYLDFTPAED